MLRLNCATALRSLSTVVFVACLLNTGCNRDGAAKVSSKTDGDGMTSIGAAHASPTATAPASTSDAPPTSPAKPSPEPPGRALAATQEKHRAASAILREVAALTHRGEFAAAHDKLDASLALRPRYPKAWATRAALLRAEGKHDESIDYVTTIVADEERTGRLLDADRSLLLREKAMAQLAKGSVDEALATVDELIVDDDPRLRERYLRAQILAARKDADATIAALEDTIEHGFLGGPELRADDAFVFLAGDERFVAILERLDAKLAANRRRVEEFLAREARVAATARPEEETNLPELPSANHTESCLVYLDRNLKRGIGKPRELSTETLLGRDDFRLSSFQGKPTIVQFWGMWSESSRDQVERLVAATDRHREDGLNVVLFNYADPDSTRDDPWADAGRWLESKGIDVPCAKVDKDRWKAFGVPAFPATYFLDASGRSVLRLFGPIEKPLLGKIADRLLASAAPKNGGIRHNIRDFSNGTPPIKGGSEQ